MSDEATNNPESREAKPKKQPKQWPGRTAAAPPPAAGDVPAASVSAPGAASQDSAAAAAGGQEVPERDQPKKQPKIWKGRSAGAPAPTAAAAAPAAPATRTAAAPPAATAAAKIAATAKPPAPIVSIPKKPEMLESEARMMRSRRFAITCVFGFLVANFVMFLRFFFPRALFEPKMVFRIGYPSDFGFGVDTKFQKDYRIWVVRNAEGLFVIYARCTHLGCTPDWIASENKFKCPCHGSGFDSDGINFEGPAPRPLDRAKVELDPEGQIIVDTSKLYQWPKGDRSQFHDPGSFLPV